MFEDIYSIIILDDKKKEYYIQKESFVKDSTEAVKAWLDLGAFFGDPSHSNAKLINLKNGMALNSEELALLVSSVALHCAKYSTTTMKK